MKATRVSLSPDPKLAAEARRRSQNSGVPTRVRQGLKRQVLAHRQSELLETWEKEFGPIPQDAIEEIARLWPD